MVKRKPKQFLYAVVSVTHGYTLASDFWADSYTRSWCLYTSQEEAEKAAKEYAENGTQTFVVMKVISTFGRENVPVERTEYA